MGASQRKNGGVQKIRSRVDAQEAILSRIPNDRGKIAD